MKKTVAVILLFIALTAGTSFASDYVIAKDFVDNGFFLKKGEKTTKNELIRRLGKPKRIEKRVDTSQSGEASNCTLYYLIYEGLHLTVLEGGKCGFKGLQYISITSSKYKLKHDLGVGTPKERVLHILGKPVFSRSNEMCYPYDQEDEDLTGTHVDFYFDARNRVSRIDWTDH